MTPAQHSDYLKKLVNKIESIKVELSEIAIKEMEGQMKQRIFNDGKATNGDSIGKYSTKNFYNKKTSSVQVGGYRQYRIDRGRQVEYVDLQLTDELFNAIKTFRIGDTWVLGIADSFNEKKSVWNEEHFNKEIFRASEEEIKAVNESVIIQIRKIIIR